MIRWWHEQEGKEADSGAAIGDDEAVENVNNYDDPHKLSILLTGSSLRMFFDIYKCTTATSIGNCMEGILLTCNEMAKLTKSGMSLEEYLKDEKKDLYK